MKEYRYHFFVLVSLFSLGPIWMIGILYILVWGIRYWAAINSGDDFGNAVLEVFCLFPAAVVLSIVTIPFIIAKIRRKYLYEFPKFIAFLPLFGILFYVIVNATYIVLHKPPIYVQDSSSAALDGSQLVMNVLGSLYDATIGPFYRFIAAPSLIDDSSEKLQFLGEAIGLIIIPLLVTILFGVLFSFLYLLLLSSEYSLNNAE